MNGGMFCYFYEVPLLLSKCAQICHLLHLLKGEKEKNVVDWVICCQLVLLNSIRFCSKQPSLQLPPSPANALPNPHPPLPPQLLTPPHHKYSPAPHSPLAQLPTWVFREQFPLSHIYHQKNWVILCVKMLKLHLVCSQDRESWGVFTEISDLKRKVFFFHTFFA